jgi:16S rRNA (cytosine967-C5)-methyltransferase
VTPVRVRAARALVAVERRRRTLAAELEHARRDLDDERDRGLLLELTAGVCRWRAELDAVIEQCSSRPIAAIDAETLATLRLALYQLRHLDRVPDHAAVHGAVEAAKALAGDRAGGFVNGVLRGYLRTQAAINLPAPPGPDATRRQQLTYLSVTHSHPKWLVARWLDRYGYAETLAWCQFNNQSPEVTVRTLAPDQDTVSWLSERGVPATRGRFAPEVATLAPGVLGELAADVKLGLAIQDEGSALVAHVVGAQPDDHVLDVCAAPGGKSVVVWNDMQQRGLLVSSDVRPARLHLLRQTLRTGGAPPRVVGLDATAPLPFGESFDRVLVDAPCSGLGTLRRDPDIKWSVVLEDLPTYAAEQLRILRRAADVVRPGGTLVYATCSSEPDENEQIVDQFLAQDSRFVREPWTGPGAEPDGCLRTRPTRDGLDAFFAARLVRRTPA